MQGSDALFTTAHTVLRNLDARYIVAGACNPVAICGTIHEHMLEMMRDGADHPTIKADPALRMMLHQLVYIMGMESMCDPNEIEEYARCYAAIGQHSE
jgi:hypothetical protein